jgi:hypothetical protein
MITRRKMSQIVLLVMALAWTPFTVFAEEETRSLPYGAGVLSHGQVAVSAALGFDLPSTPLYNLRLDVGLFDRGQSGFSFSHLSDWDDTFTNVTSYNKISLFSSKSRHHHIGVQLDPAFTYVSDVSPGVDAWLVSISPAIVYEFRALLQRQLGLYARIGTTHVLAGNAGTNDSFEFFTFSTRPGSHQIYYAVGLEHNTGHFLFGIDGGFAVRLNNRSTEGIFDVFLKTEAGFFGKIHLGWVF